MFSDCEFPIKELKLQRYNNLLDDSWHIFIAHEQKHDYLGASGTQSDPTIRSGDLDFIQDKVTSTIG